MYAYNHHSRNSYNTKGKQTNKQTNIHLGIISYYDTNAAINQSTRHKQMNQFSTKLFWYSNVLKFPRGIRSIYRFIQFIIIDFSIFHFNWFMFRSSILCQFRYEFSTNFIVFLWIFRQTYFGQDFNTLFIQIFCYNLLVYTQQMKAL